LKITNITDCTTLNNGIQMPRFGLGVFQMTEPDETVNAIRWALDAGYRSIDTAAIYKNEKETGKGIKAGSVAREDIFLTTKVWNEDMRQDRVKEAFEQSLKLLDTDYVDLYLLHWPVKGCYKRAWDTLQELYAKGRMKAIGVSNFMIENLKDIESGSDIIPAINQIEYHPHLQQPELLQYCREKNIQVEAWSPLMQGKIFTIKEITDLAEKYKKTAVQIILRWDLQNGIVTIPKSSRKERIIDNADVFNFELSEEDMGILNSLDSGTRVGPDPYTFNF
jgi:diketogulonate reductase-like aldo/keto reductase